MNPGYPVRMFWAWFGTIAFFLLVIAGVVLGGWQAGWWFTQQNATRGAETIQNGYSNQSTLRAQITAQIANTETLTSQIAASSDPDLISALKAQRAGIVGIACQDAAEVTGDPLPPQQAAWVTSNCLAGAIRPGSAYYQAGTP